MSRRPARSSPILGLASALIDEASDTLVTVGSRFRHSFEVEIGQVEPNPDQPRRRFDEKDIAALATTMRDMGQLQPILLRRRPGVSRRWTIVAGERRWRAAQLNGWPTILAIELDGDPEVASLLENLQRVDLTPHEEAQALHSLIGNKGWTQDQAAAALGRSKAEVSASLRILSLSADILEVLTSEHPVTRNVLVELARVESPAARDRLMELAREGRLTIRAIRAERDHLSPPEQAKSLTQHSRPFSYRSVETLTSHLHRIHLAGPNPNTAERKRLEALRRKIDEILENRSG